MSIASEINRIETNISSAYSALDQQGAVMPAARNSANLAKTVDSLPQATDTITIQSKNLLDLNALTPGKQLNWSTGAITDNANRNISDYIRVIPGKYLVSSYYIRKVLKPYALVAVCFYDENKEYLSGRGNVSDTIIPEGTAYIRVCGNTYMPQTSFKVQLELSDTIYPTYYEPYRADSRGLPDSIIEANRLLTQYNRNNNLRLALPRKLYCRAGDTLRVYYRNILSHPKYNIAFFTADNIVSSDTVDVSVKNCDDYAEFHASGSGGVYIPYAVYDDNFSLIVYDSVELYVSDNTAPSAYVLLIGDSTIEQDNALETQLQNLYAGSASTLTLLAHAVHQAKTMRGVPDGRLRIMLLPQARAAPPTPFGTEANSTSVIT